MPSALKDRYPGSEDGCSKELVLFLSTRGPAVRRYSDGITSASVGCNFGIVEAYEKVT
jgi:hypothetical protein